MKKKNGFTLIELIIALAIFSISFVAISASFMTSLDIRKIGNTKIETMNCAQALAEKLKEYDNISAIADNSYNYYFDDINSINFLLPSDNVNQKYKAYVKITSESDPDSSDYLVYKIYINVWINKENSKGESKMDILLYKKKTLPV